MFGKAGLALAVVVLAAAGTYMLFNLHESHAVTRAALLDRLQSVQSSLRSTGKRLTADVAEYSSAHAEGEIARARVANERVANDLSTEAQLYAKIYGDSAVVALRTESASAHDSCARSLDDLAQGNRKASDREDAECARHGMKLGEALEALGSRLDADVSSTKASLPAL